MSNAHVNHHHGMVLANTRRPKSSNAKKRNKKLARVRKSSVLTATAEKKAAMLAKM